MKSFSTGVLLGRGENGADNRLLDYLEPAVVVGRYSSVDLILGDSAAFAAPVRARPSRRTHRCVSGRRLHRSRPLPGRPVRHDHWTEPPTYGRLMRPAISRSRVTPERPVSVQSSQQLPTPTT